MTDVRRGEGFLARWSRRKEATPETREREDLRVAEDRGDDPPADSSPVAQAAPADLPAPETLTPQSDFTRFMRPDVPPGLRNAAMKKLFADPHFNLMDGLDVYIDDYTRPDPIPPAMLRELAQAGMLKLFESEEEPQGTQVETRPATAQHEEGGTPGEYPAPPPEGAATTIDPEGHQGDIT